MCIRDRFITERGQQILTQFDQGRFVVHEQNHLTLTEAHQLLGVGVRIGIVLGTRQIQMKNRPVIRLAVDAHRAAVIGDDAVDDG